MEEEYSKDTSHKTHEEKHDVHHEKHDPDMQHEEPKKQHEEPKKQHEEPKKQHEEHHKKQEEHKKPIHHHVPKEKILTKQIMVLMVVAIIVIVFNQVKINAISSGMTTAISVSSVSSGGFRSETINLANINIDELKSTGHTIAAVFPVEEIQTVEDTMAMLFPTGTPDYGEELGVSYDDPVGSLAILAKMYNGLMAEVKQSNPEGWQRYLNLATKPVGISCEYCCGVGPTGIRADGRSSCGCQHNPALLSVALYLSAYTDYNDGEILREVMRWKTLFFPKNMIELGTSLAGGDTSALDNLPGMVGGC